MAFSGQIGTQPPQPLQPASLMTATSRPLSASCDIAPYGHEVSHLPHHVHLSGSTIATSGSSSATPFLRTDALWVTAASPEATLSAELFGPWQVPAMRTPSTMVS